MSTRDVPIPTAIDFRTEHRFFIGDNSYRSCLAKAFKHAVILCGGKPSTF
jgi:hypothetical protein